ncbi:MAG: cysteine desulfurase [Paramuribaculum sp.]|nr:cysteine desulfurase [Paramuribaculum sp.]
MENSTYDIDKYRRDFPILSRQLFGKPMVYLDNTATTQTPRRVVDAITEMYFTHKANVHRGVHTLSLEATELMEEARRLTASYINASSTEEIIFTRGTTEAINLVASSYGSLLKEGDEVILSVMEHHSNIVPWQLLRDRIGIKLKVIPMTSTWELDMEEYRRMLNPRVKMVAVTHVSNVLGTVNPVGEIISLAHNHGAAVLIDGAQAIAHLPIDVRALDADFYAFSAHKMYGPCGVGILYGKKHLLESMPPYQGGGEMIHKVNFAHTEYAALPYKFEAGTPDFVDIAAFREALGYIRSIGIENIAEHEERLLRYTTERMKLLPRVRIYGEAPVKSAVISFLVEGAHHYDTGMLLDKQAVAVRTGHHCAQPLMESLGITGTVRASFGLYNTFEECDRFIAALTRILTML